MYIYIDHALNRVTAKNIHSSERNIFELKKKGSYLKNKGDRKEKKSLRER